jgi:para-nitrobenzyl esterase
MGESEGAFCLSAMLATDHPERLFRRVALQSGSGYLVHSAAYERALAGSFPVRSITALKAMPVTRLLELQNKVVEKDAPGVLGALYFGPYIDGTLVRGPVTERIVRGNARRVDVLIGFNRDEVNFFGQFAPDGRRLVAEQYDAGIFPRHLAAYRQHMIETYRKGRSAQDATLAMFTDQSLRVPAVRLAEAQGRWRPTYVYEFGWRPPKGAGAVHTIELPFVFGALSFTGIPGGARALRADRARMNTLSEQMMDAWTSFARTGDPATRRTAPGPVWPTYTAPRRATMIWDLPARIADDPRGDERALWDPLAFDDFILQPE